MLCRLMMCWLSLGLRRWFISLRILRIWAALMSLKKFSQDPAEVLDYTLDWSEWLPGGDTIVSCTATGTSGLTVGATPTFTTTSTTVWISGGSPGSEYAVSIQVVTAGGRTGERSITIQIKEK